MQRPKILVTSAAGRTGSAAILQLMDKGFPSTEDIARVIVGALADPTHHLGKTYRPTGPERLSPEDIAPDSK